MRSHSTIASIFIAALIAASTLPAKAIEYTATILHPRGGFVFSEALAVSGTFQFGRGYGPATAGQYHALLWTGASDNLVDLHPDGFSYSYGLDAHDNIQVGFGQKYELFEDGYCRALMWQGSADSVVDLHPAGFHTSSANAVWGNTQVGGGYSLSDDESHALLWHRRPS